MVRAEHGGPSPRERDQTPVGQAGAARQPDRAPARAARALLRHRRLRGDRHPPDRERHPVRPGHRLPGRARPGQDPHGARSSSACSTRRCPRSPAARSTTTRSRRSARRAGQRVAEQGTRRRSTWIPRDRRYGEKLATPDITIADLIGEVDPIKVAEGRYLSDELTIHYGLLPRTNRGIFAHQRAARPRRAHPGGPAQHHGRARRPDPRLQGAAAARPLRGGERQPGGLHQPRAHHHAAQGPLRLADPHPLPAHASSTRSPSWRRSAPASPPTGSRSAAPST